MTRLKTFIRLPLLLAIAVGFFCIPEVVADDRNSSKQEQQKKSSSKSSLSALQFQGNELHASLKNRRMDKTVRHIPAGQIPTKNPHISREADFVRSIARAGSQGRLNEDNVLAVLYALYVAEHELGFYGIESDSMAAADRREAKLRRIWAKNMSFDRAQVHRNGLVTLVVWTDGVSPECWEAVNSKIAERLKGKDDQKGKDRDSNDRALGTR